MLNTKEKNIVRVRNLFGFRPRSLVRLVHTGKMHRLKYIKNRSSICLIVTCTLLLLTQSIAHALVGIESTFEYAMDAPWRMEPSVGPDGQIEYGPISDSNHHP